MRTATKHCLVPSPARIGWGWQSEAARFTPGLRVLPLHGPTREALFEAIPEHDLVLTTYPLLWRDEHTLQLGDDGGLRIDAEDPWVEPLLSRLRSGFRRGSFDVIAHAAGAPREAARTLLARLDDVLDVVDAVAGEGQAGQTQGEQHALQQEHLHAAQPVAPGQPDQASHQLQVGGCVGRRDGGHGLEFFKMRRN
jgi:hypothetical protein